MQFERKRPIQKFVNIFSHARKMLSRFAQNDEVVAIAEIPPLTKKKFHIPIQFVKIYVCKQLTREITERDAASIADRETADNTLK